MRPSYKHNICGFVITPHLFVSKLNKTISNWPQTTLCFLCKVCCSGDFEQAKDQGPGGLIQGTGCSEKEKVSLITLFDFNYNKLSSSEMRYVAISETITHLLAH